MKGYQQPCSSPLILSICLSAPLSLCFIVSLFYCLLLNHRQLEKPFPEQLYTGGSTFFIGSRRRWSGQFSVRNSSFSHSPVSHIYVSHQHSPVSHQYIFYFLLLSAYLCLTQGLIRQLVLMPGSDVSSRLCPSSDPTLSVLSVPQVLQHLPVKPSSNLPLYPYGENELMLVLAFAQNTYHL